MQPSVRIFLHASAAIQRSGFTFFPQGRMKWLRCSQPRQLNPNEAALPGPSFLSCSGKANQTSQPSPIADIWHMHFAIRNPKWHCMLIWYDLICIYFNVILSCLPVGVRQCQLPSRRLHHMTYNILLSYKIFCPGPECCPRMECHQAHPAICQVSLDAWTTQKSHSDYWLNVRQCSHHRRDLPKWIESWSMVNSFKRSTHGPCPVSQNKIQLQLFKFMWACMYVCIIYPPTPAVTKAGAAPGTTAGVEQVFVGLPSNPYNAPRQLAPRTP